MAQPPKSLPGELIVLAPMALEARLLAASAPSFTVRRTGIGRRRALAAGRALREHGAPPVLVMGFAGGLEPDAQAGEVIVADELLGPSGERVACQAAELLAALLSEGGLTVRRGPVASVTRPALGRARTRLRQAGALAADMESLWVAESAQSRVFGVVRVIADVPGPGAWRPWRAINRFRAARRALAQAAAVFERARVASARAG